MSGRVAVLLFFAATFYTEFPFGSAYNWKAFPDTETIIIYPDKKSATMTWKWSLQRNTKLNNEEIITGLVIKRFQVEKQLATEKEIGKYLYGGPGNEEIETDDSLFSLRFEKGVVGGKDGFAEFTIKDVARQGNNNDGSPVNVETGNYTYICEMTLLYVVNNPGPKSTTLIVYEKPSFTNTPKSKQTSSNNVTLECTAKGRPQPRISWTILETSGESRVTESQTRLTINPKSDSGVYNCTARSVAGSVAAVAAVQYIGCDSTCSTDSMGIEMTGLTFKSDYENINSKESEKLKNIIEQECLRVYATYSPNKPIYSCRVLNFRSGSVVANVQITYPSTVRNPREPLEKAIETGTFAGQAVKKSFVSPTKVPPHTTSPPMTITTTGAYISPTTTISTTVETKASSGGCRVCCIILGVLFGVSLIFNVIFVGFFIWRHLTENNRQSNESENIIGVGYMSTFALQEQPTSTDEQNVVQYEHVGNGREQESANTTMYHSISPHTDTYSSLSPSTKLPPKPAGITISGIYQDIPATSQQYQSLDSFNRV